MRTLNLIYTNEGNINLPANKRNGVFSLLQDKRHHLVNVTSATEEEKTQILADITDGKFDLIATAKANSEKPTLPDISQNNRYPVKVDKTADKNELQLLRVWRTGEFFTYNQRTGNLNKLNDSRAGKYKSVTNTLGTFKVLPGDKNWNYAFDEETNFYKKYLIQDDIAGKIPQNALSVISELQNETATNRRPRVPPLNLRLPENKRYPLERSWSYTSDSKDTFYRRYLRGEIPLQRSLTDRVQVHRLTRSNVLRHEFYQV